VERYVLDEKMGKLFSQKIASFWYDAGCGFISKIRNIPQEAVMNIAQVCAKLRAQMVLFLGKLSGYFPLTPMPVFVYSFVIVMGG